jgi:hypothetical protein
LAGDCVADEVELFLAAVVAGVDFLAGADELADFFVVAAEDVFLAVDFLAVDFLAGDDVFLAVDFFAVEDAFFAVDFAVDFVAGEEAEALAFVAVDSFASPPTPGTALAAAAAAALTALSATARVSAGSCRAPETTALRSAPGRNFGTAVSAAWVRSPVRGLRTVRASRTLFSNEPNPVIATFSPRATSRVMVSMTASSAWAAAFRFPS